MTKTVKTQLLEPILVYLGAVLHFWFRFWSLDRLDNAVSIAVGVVVFIYTVIKIIQSKSAKNIKKVVGEWVKELKE